MLEVDINHQIILMYFREGLSLRSIAKQLKINRHTVKSRVDQYSQFKTASVTKSGTTAASITKYLQTGTVYDVSTRKPRRLNDEIAAIIHTCLEQNEAKQLDGRQKQQLKKIDIHEKILAAGHEVSYSTLCKYIVDRALHAREAFIKQDYAVGSSCEFDWAEVKILINGVLRRFYMAVFTSSFSNYRFALLFERQDSLAFRESHILFFDHIGGVFLQMVYDNMRVAIASFVGKTEKAPTEALLQLSRWYQYQWRFCNVARGNEKGHVEPVLKWYLARPLRAGMILRALRKRKRICCKRSWS
jgi:transposase-like protein